MSSLAVEPRDTATAVKRGMMGRCPQCGDGHLFRAYLKVVDACPVCGEVLEHQRADDAPPYVTIFIVGHVILALVLLVDDMWPTLSLWIHAALWLTLTMGLSLAILPIVKGGLVGLQWAQRMHGFGGTA